jgi:hypothetical protein
MSGDPLLRRIDRIESVQAIQQLAIRYALAVDGRDLDGWVALFAKDVNCGRHGAGRAVLRTLIEPDLRTFYRSIHFICGHRIEFDDADSAHGVVYCRAEHEVGARWPVMAIAYFDSYVRQDGAWYFARRQEKHWYSTDFAERPAPPFHQWPPGSAECRLPGDFEHWRDFWEKSEHAAVRALTSEPVEAT